MRKLFLTSLIALYAMTAMAQVNIQLKYDFGRNIYSESESNRPKVISTVEMFRPDATGYTYFFIDMAYFSDGMGGTYWEISREFSIKNLKSGNFGAHIEYDGGLAVNKYTPQYASRFQQSFLTGLSYNWHSADFSKIFTLQTLYKQYIANKTCDAIASFQVTGVWGVTFAHGLCTCSGFADLWYGYKPRFGADGRQEKGLVFLTQPQFLFNVINKDKQNGKFSIGAQLEVSNDLVWPTDSKQSFFINPSLAMKYTF